MSMPMRMMSLVVVLFIGVVLGLETADQGIKNVYGAFDQPQTSFYISKIDQGRVEYKPLGQVQRMEPEMVNYISRTGMFLGGMVKSSISRGVDWLASFFVPAPVAMTERTD